MKSCKRLRGGVLKIVRVGGCRLLRREQREGCSRKFLCLFFILLLSFQQFLYIYASTQQADPQREKIKKYLLEGETITREQKLSFGRDSNKITLTIYYLSSGRFLIYSENHDAVVLGDEWMGMKDGESLALQLISLYAYDRYKPLDNFKLENYNALYERWNKGSEVAKNYFLRRTIKVSILKLLAGTALVIISSAATGGVSILLILGYGAGLANALFVDLMGNLKISEENAPRLFLVLSLMPSEDETAYENFHKSLKNLNPKFRDSISNIAKSIKLVEKARALSGLNFMIFYTFAAKNPSLLQNLENIFGRDLVEKAGAYFIFRGDKRAFGEFSKAVSDYWNKVPGSAGKLSDILTKKAVGALGSMALGAVIDAIADHAIKASKDVDSLMGFHGAHSVLIRDLSLDLSGMLARLQSQDCLPTLENVQMFLYYEYLLYVLLSEYDDGISNLSTSTLCKAPEELIHFWGFSTPTTQPGTTTETWAGTIRGTFSSYKSLVDQHANDVLTRALNYTVEVYKMFEEYKQDMARRRSIPSPMTGIDLFIVMDISGSMDERFQGARKIDAAKRAAADLVLLTSGQDNIGLIEFSSTAKLVSDLTNDKKLIIDKINKMEPESTTALGDGIWLAIEELADRKRPKAVIVLTDGKNNAGIHSPREAALKAKSLNIPIYTLGFGEKGDIDENILLEIAQVTNALYYYAPSPDHLRKIYISLSQQVSGSITEEPIIRKIKKGEEQIATVSIAPGTSYLSVKASYGGSKISMMLQRPDGLYITGTEGNVVYKEEPGYISYTVYYPDPGEWRAKVVGVETPPEGEEYRLVVAKPGILVEPQEINVDLRPGESAKVKVRMRALRPLLSINISKLGNSEFFDIEQSAFSNIRENEDIYFYVVLRAPEDLRKGFFFRGLLGIRAVDSLLFLPVNMRITGFLMLNVLANASILYEGQSLNLKARVTDESGSPITGASVKATVDGTTKDLVEIGDGFFSVDFKGLSLGRKTIEIAASKPGYADVATSLEITITVLGDINKDGLVNYKDLALLIKSYGLPAFHPDAAAGSDLNEDGKVDYRDLAILLGNYGKNVP